MEKYVQNRTVLPGTSPKKCCTTIQFRKIGGYKVAIQSANNYRTLRKAGITVRKKIDIIIATYCIIE